MYSLSSCVMYKNLDATIRLDEDAVFLTIADKDHNSVSMTLNPIQVLTLAKYLYAALSEIKLEDIYKSELFGNLTAQIDNAWRNLKFPKVAMVMNFITMTTTNCKLPTVNLDSIVVEKPSEKSEGSIFYGGLILCQQQNLFVRMASVSKFRIV